MSNDRAYELRELMENLIKASEAVAERTRESLDAMFGLERAPAAEPDRFVHIDEHGDSFAVAVTPIERFVLELDASTTAEIPLDQDAVNRLAQYLDRHRTDQADTDALLRCASPVKSWCGACGHYAHGTVGCREEEPGSSLLKCLCRGGSDGA